MMWSADHATVVHRPRSIAVRATYVPDRLSVSGRPAGPRVGGGALPFSWTAANLPPPPTSMVTLGDRHGRPAGPRVGGGALPFSWTAANLPPPPTAMVTLGDRHGSRAVEFGSGRMSMTTTTN